MNDVKVPRGRAAQCARNAADAYRREGDNRVASILDGVALAIEAIVPEAQKPMTLVELKQLPYDAVVWEEWRREEFVSLRQTYGSVLAHMCIHHGDGSLYNYGHDVRAWRRLPTDEERAAAEWDN